MFHRPTPNTPSKADNFQLNHHLWTSHRPSPLIKMRSSAALRMFRQTPRMLRPVPKEDQAGHTISQRLRKLKSIPPELYPLAVVVAFALSAATYSISRKFVVDKNLRLARQGPSARATDHSSHGEEHKEEH
ncbi:hypothetical protein B0J13DRAFT_544439 [Dactylonectria estremocensis]|uniref:NADH-ubiquinone reductase complex 1 MLRQ subunit n=1 Tax=Dactylonectria estremocensis TaxID=1079267 RepID=A0A9P9JCI7_9HYPO|nr:hypothetical protein B0J13DRAFT_544439 [Dactylonectria estremocensis]